VTLHRPDAEPTDGAAWSTPWIWSVLRYEARPESRVLFRSASMSPASIQRIVDDATSGGAGTQLEVTLWDAPEPLADAMTRRLDPLRRIGVDVHVFHGLADDARGITVAEQTPALSFRGAGAPRTTTGGTGDHAANGHDGDTAVGRTVRDGGA
jgi:hypothetical protein